MREKARGSARTATAWTRQSAPARANRYASSSPIGRTLALQRTIGNQATRTLLRRAPTSSRTTTPEVAPSVESHINNLNGCGRALPDATRSFFEPRFGQDFSDVRVHTDAASRASAQAVDAAAYTVGRNIVIGEGQYAPDTAQGQRLLAHELTHVVQQSGTGGAALQRQRQADLCTGMPASEMAPRQWRKCLDAGKLTVEDGDPVRFTFSGEIATPESLIKWMKRKDMTKEVVIRHLRSSHEFTGAPAAVDALINAFVNAIPVAKASICLRPVHIADDSGKNPTTMPSFDAVIAIWKKCCIDVSVTGATTVSKTAFKTIDHDAGSGKATPEERNMITMAGASKCVSVFVVDKFQESGRVSKDISGGAAAFGSSLGGAIIAVEGVHPTIIAHELGHAMGHSDHAPPGTIMAVIASKHTQQESDKVNSDLCESVRKFFTSAGAKEDCYPNIP